MRPKKPMGGADILAAMKRCDDLEAFLDKKLIDARPSFNFEKLGSPLLSHVGIIDINKAIESLDEEAQIAINELYTVGGSFPIHVLRQDIEDDVVASSRLAQAINGTSSFESSLYWTDLELLQNSFYPVMADGFIGRLASTELWKRLLGVAQLSWDRDYPLTS